MGSCSAILPRLLLVLQFCPKQAPYTFGNWPRGVTGKRSVPQGGSFIPCAQLNPAKPERIKEAAR